MSKPVTVHNLDGVFIAQGPLHLAVGMFDGVHLGHQAVIESALLAARRSGGVAGVLTFEPHPSHLIRPDRPTPLIVNGVTKERLLRHFGMELLIVLPFTKDFAGIEAVDFLKYLKEKMPALESIHVGQNFRFGKGRSGDVTLMAGIAQEMGINIFSVDRMQCNAVPISSTRIRGALQEGDIDEVNMLLGYHYFSEGEVISGRQLGRKIGFPTLNIRWNPELKPKYGVYLAEVIGRDKAYYPAILNYGVKPTVQDPDEDPLIEVHILGDQSPNLGDYLFVYWLKFLRSEKKFSDLELLKAQISDDVAKARQFFENHKGSLCVF